MVYSDRIKSSKSLIELRGLPNIASWLQINSNNAPLITLSPVIYL